MAGANAMRLASYNVENLFERAKAMNGPDWQAGREILAAQAELNALFGKPSYAEADKARMIVLLDQLGLEKSDDGKFAILRQNRGRLRSRQGGRLTIVASGRSDWVGWVDLQTEPVTAEAIANTGRVIGLLDADIVAVIEAENRPALRRFSDQLLPQVAVPPYPHIMLIDGNDDRGIDVGLMTREGFAVRSMVSHVDDRGDDGRRLFSRDCPEYEIALPSGEILWLLINHFKSKGFGSPAASNARRRAQAARVREIYEARLAAGVTLVAIAGDLNDTPDSAQLAPLFEGGTLIDVSDHPRFVSDGRVGTFKNGTRNDKLDYIILSPALAERVTGGGIERRGVWGGKNGTLFPHLPEIVEETDAASDHAAIWVDLEL